MLTVEQQNALEAAKAAKIVELQKAGFQPISGIGTQFDESHNGRAAQVAVGSDNGTPSHTRVIDVISSAGKKWQISQYFVTLDGKSEWVADVRHNQTPIQIGMQVTLYVEKQENGRLRASIK